jgi:hypothetical protein
MTRFRILLALVFTCAAPLSAQPTLNSLQQQVQRLIAAQRKADTLLAQLDARILALEAEAEKVDPEDALAKQEEDNKEKQMANLERRLAALERAPSGGKGRGDAPAGNRLRAPFIVEDDDGDVIFRVVGGKSPRLFIGNEKGGNIEMGTGAAGGGVIRVRDGESEDRLLLVATSGYGELRALSDKYSATLSSGSSEGGATLNLLRGDVPTLQAASGLQGNGRITVASPAGDILVWIGQTTSGLGTVRTGPAQRVGAMGPPSVLMGTKGK